MATTSIGPLLRHLRKILDPTHGPNVRDAELLDRFVQQRDEVAFELLVWRHQRMVLGVCRRVLGNAHDAEDAFQAAFLALARKAASLRRQGAVAGWLHKVAYHIALRARKNAAKQKTVELDSAGLISLSGPAEDAIRRELAAVLDEEVSRLPQKYRLPVVLCYLEGMTYLEAGRQLGVPIGTLSARLTRARDLLRTRLLRRGISVSGAMLAVVLGEQASAAAPAALVHATVKTAAGAVSVSVAALTEGVLRSMLVSKLKIGMAALLAGLLVTGMGLLVSAGARPQPPANQESAEPPPLASTKKKATARVDDYGDPLPDGALRRLGTLRFRHGGGIEQLLLTPDGKTLVSNDYYGTRTVCVWEMATGKLLHRLPGSYDQKTIALSPDGKLLAIGQKKAIVLWDLVSGKEVRRLPQTDTFGFAFSPDGKILAAGDFGPRIHLWDLATGKKIAQFKGKRDPIHVDLLAFTPDGRTVIAGEKFDSKIGLWDAASGKKRLELDAKAGDIFMFALSPDGVLLATGSRKGGIPLWNVKTGELVRKLGSEGGRGCYAVAFSPDGKTLAAHERDANDQEDSLSIWDVAAGKELHRFKGDIGIWRIAYSRNGKMLIVGSNGAIHLLDAATGKEIGPTAGAPGFVRLATMSPDGRTLAYLRNRDIRFWDMKAGREIGAINVHPNGIQSLAFSPDSKTVAAGVGDYAVNLWDVRSCKFLRRLQWDKKESRYAYWAFAVSFSPDGRLLASTDSKAPFVRLWDVTTGKQVRQLTLSDPKNPKKNWYDPDAVAFSPDGRLLAASGRTVLEGSWVTIWEAATGKELPHLTRAINDSDQRDEPQHSPGASRKFMRPKVAFSPNGRMLVKNVRSKTIPIWETVTGRQRLLLKGHEESAVCVAFAPDGRTLASASWDETIRLWDLDSGRELRKLTGHRGKANSLAFSADGKVLVSAGDDTTILFWDVADITGRKRPHSAPLPAREWQALWEDLTRDDAAKAYAAMVRMAADGPTTIAALRERLRPVRPVDPDRLAKLLKDLDSDAFAVREAASRELEKLGDVVLPAVRRTLAHPGLSLELRRRLEALSSSLEEISGERLRPLRAIEVLEMLGTAEARELLKTLAGGAPEALPTTAAQAALKRLPR